MDIIIIQILLINNYIIYMVKVYGGQKNGIFWKVPLYFNFHDYFTKNRKKIPSIHFIKDILYILYIIIYIRYTTKANHRTDQNKIYSSVRSVIWSHHHSTRCSHIMICARCSHIMVQHTLFSYNDMRTMFSYNGSAHAVLI